MPHFLHRPTPLDDWRVVTDRPTEGEWVELRGVHWWSQAQAEADKLNGKGDGEQGVLGI